MSLVFAAFVPHSPVLLPTLGQEHLAKAEKTLTAFKQLEEELIAAKPETILIISGHGEKIPGAFCFNHNPQPTANFKNFGDLKTSLTFNNDLGLAYKIKEKLETTLPIQLTTPENVSYGVSIPLYYLTKALPETKIIPIQTSDLSLDKHWQLGTLIRHELELVNKRVAIIAAGNLAHTNLEKSDSQTDLAAEQFNQKFLDIFKNWQTHSLLEISERAIEQLEVCGLKPAALLAGCLQGLALKPKILSYEMPLGIGWAVISLDLS